MLYEYWGFSCLSSVSLNDKKKSNPFSRIGYSAYCKKNCSANPNYYSHIKS
nr:MAG TPA: hypothetical protein [Crassvirales sp.]